MVMGSLLLVALLEQRETLYPKKGKTASQTRGSLETAWTKYDLQHVRILILLFLNSCTVQIKHNNTLMTLKVRHKVQTL